jgi:hypothetical protein
MQRSSGLRTTSVLCLFLLPLGQPGLRLGSAALAFFSTFFAWLAVFSSALRMVYSTDMGEGRCYSTLTNDRTKNDRLGMTFFVANLERNNPAPTSFYPLCLPRIHRLPGYKRYLFASSVS